MNIIFKAWPGLILLLLQSCQSYQQLELDPDQILKEIEESRKIPLQKSLSFDQAAILMSERNH